MRYLAFVFLSLALAGCGSSPSELQYYRLPAVAVKAPQGDSSKVLVIEPVMVASYLNSNALVYQNNAVNLQLTRTHQWAEALDQQLTRNLLAHLSAALTDWRVTQQVNSSADSRLTVQVTQFHTTADGLVLISGQAHLLTGAVVKQMPFELELPIADDGYDEVVKSLGEGWSQVASQIAVMITESPAA
ncbi:ABC-type transport auxiliary lipoprotein family protein [Rheinheimera soli]|uniref:ABC-type transport auxiliary lipoprotein family protein n=1 Tax=Rheinheimera soli TaxID=443616 RepID=UPI001E631079|nr:ABC-type transport auxiliary lipoprotein family protein [Rheinheimera soli]